MTWRQVMVRCTESQAESIAAALERLGAASVSFVDSEDVAVFEPPPGEAILWAHTTVSALFPGGPSDEHLRARIVDALDPAVSDTVALETLPERDWVRDTQAGFEARTYGHGLWVLPHGAEPPAPARTVVYLDPGVAFGTGSHPTTRLCLEWLGEQASTSGSDALGRVLDYGAGSGILAVAALALGARAAVMIDIDPQAVAAARDNAARNRVGPVSAGLPNALDTLLSAPADTVIANILLEPLIELAPILLAKGGAGARLCLSGILDHQLEALSACYGPWLDDIEHRVDDGWARLSGIRNRCKAP